MPRTRVLLVDDYPDALEMWGLYLRSLGYDVATAADGQTALDMALALVPDVIVMDLELPGITGFEAARRLKQHELTAAVPLIAATGYSHTRQIEQARQSGFDAIIVKPTDPGALVAEIERRLAAARSPGEPGGRSAQLNDLVKRSAKDR
jgi:CheY-like chemotaxis protein